MRTVQDIFWIQGGSGLKKDLSSRVHLIDEVRGFAIICMVFYHAMYDLVVIFGVDFPVFTSPVMQDILQPLFAGLFIFISGTAGHYSRSNLKRGAICFALGMALTLVTAVFMPAELIAFGILHFLGIAMMLFPLLKRFAVHMPPALGVAAGLLFFWFFSNIPQGSVGLAPFFTISLPRALYGTPYLFALGFPGTGFFSSDYFPILPWMFAFFAGVCFGRLVRDGRCPKWFYRMHCRPLAFVGRHTIVVYLLHQPVCYGLILLIFTLLPNL